MSSVDGAHLAALDFQTPQASDEPEDSHSGLPAYLRIVGTIADRISAGTYAPGSRLPSGSQLCAEYGVSQMTVRRAFAALKSQGLISCVKGRGSFVRSSDLSNSTFRLSSAVGEWLDESAEIRLLSVSMARADERTATRLDIALGQRVVCLRRLVSYDGCPAMFHTEYVTYDPRLPLLESQLQLTSLHAFLDSERGHRFPRGELTARAVNLDRESADALGEREDAAALCLEHLFRDDDGRPVSLGWFLLRAEQFQLRAQLGSE